MPRGGPQTPQGFMYGAPHNQMGMNDPRVQQGQVGGPQGPGGRGGNPWGQGPRTPGGPQGNMMMNQRGPQGVRSLHFLLCCELKCFSLKTRGSHT